MRKLTDPVSQRLVRKGALVEETYNLFRNWKDGISFDENFNDAFRGGFRTEGWKKEIFVTLRRRFRDIHNAKSLIILARRGYPPSDWTYCLHFWIALRETLYGLFVETWLYPEYQSGRLILRTEDAVEHVRTVRKLLNEKNKPLTDYGVLRTARDLLRMSRDLGLLEGEGVTKRFASVHLSDDLLLYFCHSIASEEKSTSRVLTSDLWKLLLIDQERVHAHLLRLHQYRKVNYEIAGSVVQLTLPFANPVECAERIAV